MKPVQNQNIDLVLLEGVAGPDDVNESRRS
jgi:hypothetical protein